MSMSRFSLIMMSAIFGVGAVSVPAGAQDTRALITACVDKKIQAYEARQPFAVEGQVSCPAADIVGFARVRRHDRRATVTFNAPKDREIVNESVSSVQIDVLSSISGTHGNPIISPDRKTVTVLISCSGRSIGQGRATHHIRVRGDTKRVPDTEKTIGWTIDCARKVASK